MTRTLVKLVSSALILGAVAMSTAALAADYPKGTITSIVPFTPGGTSDALARIYSTALSDKLGQTVIVDNRPGASGNIGAAAAAKSAPDGLTILFSSSSMVWNPALYSQLPYDPMKDVIPVALLAVSPQVISVNAEKFPTQSLGEVIDYAKAHPGELNIAAAGIGPMERDFALQNGIAAEIIPYPGSGDALTAVLSGEADVIMGSALALMSVLDTGRVRPIAVADDHRLEALPDVPTTTEAGFPKIKQSFPFGAFLPAGTSPEIVGELHDLLNNATGLPAVQEQIKRLGWMPVQYSTDEFKTYYADQIALWKNIVDVSGIEKLN